MTDPTHPSPRARGLLKLLALIALLLAAAYVLRASPARGWFTPQGAAQVAAALRQLWWAPFAFVAAYTIAAALDFSGLVLTLVGGAVFGFWWGVVLNLVGANLGASAAFWVARLLGREGLQAISGGGLAGLDRLTRDVGFAWLLRLRLIPVVPFNLLNFASGLTAIPWRTYAGATAVGIVPATVVYTFFADTLLSGSEQAGHRVFLRLLVAGGLLVLLSFVPALARRLGWTAPAASERLPAGPPQGR